MIKLLDLSAPLRRVGLVAPLWTGVNVWDDIQKEKIHIR